MNTKYLPEAVRQLWLDENADVMAAADVSTLEEALESDAVIGGDDAGPITLAQHTLHTLVDCYYRIQRGRSGQERVVINLRIPQAMLEDLKAVADLLGTSLDYVVEHDIYEQMLKRRLAFNATKVAAEQVMASRMDAMAQPSLQVVATQSDGDAKHVTDASDLEAAKQVITSYKFSGGDYRSIELIHAGQVLSRITKDEETDAWSDESEIVYAEARQAARDLNHQLSDKPWFIGADVMGGDPPAIEVTTEYHEEYAALQLARALPPHHSELTSDGLTWLGFRLVMVQRASEE